MVGAPAAEEAEERLWARAIVPVPVKEVTVQLNPVTATLYVRPMVAVTGRV